VSPPPDRPVVIYDGACGICTSQVDRLRRLTGDKLRFESFRDPDVLARYPELKPEECEAALQLIVPQADGTRRVYSGADGVVRAASKNRLLRVLLWPYYFPPIRLAADSAYRWVARNRFRLSKICGKEGCAAHRPQTPPQT
jgi:predicted DCC family thiol-disulfide oxidoreductase YuxK